MIRKSDLTSVQKILQKNIGKKIKLTSKKGRKKAITKLGTIEQTFSSVFVIKLDDENSRFSRRVSYSYTDLLTKTIELAFY